MWKLQHQLLPLQECYTNDASLRRWHGDSFTLVALFVRIRQSGTICTRRIMNILIVINPCTTSVTWRHRYRILVFIIAIFLRVAITDARHNPDVMCLFTNKHYGRLNDLIHYHQHVSRFARVAHAGTSLWMSDEEINWFIVCERLRLVKRSRHIPVLEKWLGFIRPGLSVWEESWRNGIGDAGPV